MKHLPCKVLLLSCVCIFILSNTSTAEVLINDNNVPLLAQRNNDIFINPRTKVYSKEVRVDSAKAALDLTTCYIQHFDAACRQVQKAKSRFFAPTTSVKTKEEAIALCKKADAELPVIQTYADHEMLGSFMIQNRLPSLHSGHGFHNGSYLRLDGRPLRGLDHTNVKKCGADADLSDNDLSALEPVYDVGAKLHLCAAEKSKRFVVCERRYGSRSSAAEECSAQTQQMLEKTKILRAELSSFEENTATFTYQNVTLDSEAPIHYDFIEETNSTDICHSGRQKRAFGIFVASAALTTATVSLSTSAAALAKVNHLENDFDNQKAVLRGMNANIGMVSADLDTLKAIVRDVASDLRRLSRTTKDAFEELQNNIYFEQKSTQIYRLLHQVQIFIATLHTMSLGVINAATTEALISHPELLLVQQHAIRSEGLQVSIERKDILPSFVKINDRVFIMFSFICSPDESRFQYWHMDPLPFLLDTHSLTPILMHSTIAINPKTRHFAFLSDDREQVDTFSTPRFPGLITAYTSSVCGPSNLVGLPGNCTFRRTPQRPFFFKPLSSGVIYSLPDGQSAKSTVSCNSTSTETTSLTGTGFLNVDPGCKIEILKHPLRFFAEKFMSNTTHGLLRPVELVLLGSSASRATSFEFSPLPLNSTFLSMKTVDKLLPASLKITPYTSTTAVVSAVLITIALLIILYFLCRTRKAAKLSKAVLRRTGLAESNDESNEFLRQLVVTDKGRQSLVRLLADPPAPSSPTASTKLAAYRYFSEGTPPAQTQAQTIYRPESAGSSAPAPATTRTTTISTTRPTPTPKQHQSL